MHAVKTLARECGFDLCGIARAIPGDEDARLREWLAKGYHGDMKYMERRGDVRELLPGCRSVIALGVNYYVPHARPEGPRVSRYEWGDDYHRVLGRMLDSFLATLKEGAPGEGFLACCHTSPVMEKAWAERAGIGCIGKNGCLISQRKAAAANPALAISLPGREVYMAALADFGSGASGMRPISLVPSLTEAAWLAMLPPLAVFLVTVGLREEVMKQAVYVFLAMAAFQAVLALMFGGGSSTAFRMNPGDIGTAVGTYVNRNHLAGLLEMACRSRWACSHQESDAVVAKPAMPAATG